MSLKKAQKVAQAKKETKQPKTEARQSTMPTKNVIFEKKNRRK